MRRPPQDSSTTSQDMCDSRIWEGFQKKKKLRKSLACFCDVMPLFHIFNDPVCDASYSFWEPSHPPLYMLIHTNIHPGMT